MNLPAFRITLENGHSYVTNMAQGTTIEEAASYYEGQSLVMGDESALVRVVRVEEV